jgi:lysophosphatidate acyltransferase
MTVSGILLKYLLTPYLASIAILYILSWTLPPHARRLPSFFARLLASVGCLGLAASYGIFSALLLRLVGKEGLTQWTVAKCFKYLMLLSTGVSVEVVEGAEYLSTRPAVYIGNHQSYVYSL